MSRLAAALTGEADPAITSLVVFNANPAATVRDQTRAHEGLRREDLFTTVLEQRWTDTCDYADVVLPATMQPEHFDLHSSYGHHYTTLNLPVVRTPGDALPNTEIFRRIAAAMGLDHPRLRDSDEDLARQLLRDTPVSFEELRERTYARTTGVAVGSAPFAAGGFPTPDGRARLLDPELERHGVDPLVGYTPPVEAADLELAERFPLVLVAPAGRFIMNSTFASLPWHVGKMGPPRVHLHPDDAAARGLVDGSAVRVRNDRGSFLAAVAFDDATRPGLAFTYKAYWPRRSPGRTNVNAVTAVRDTDLGGGPTFHDTRGGRGSAGRTDRRQPDARRGRSYPSTDRLQRRSQRLHACTAPHTFRRANKEARASPHRQSRTFEGVVERAHRGYLFNLIYDLSLARLGRGGRWVALTCGCPRLMGVTLIWRAPAGHRGREWLKRGLPSSK